MTKENIKNKSMNELIEELVIEDADFIKLQDALSVYCPFEAVGMVNAEIRHSAFLAHSMDPYRPHGFGHEFLRITLDTIIKSLEAAPISRLELHLADFDDVEVRREWRHIDVLVVLPAPRLIIAFELKIGANEGYDQLGRYSRALEDAWPTGGEHPWRHLKLFLTRTGDQPSDPSWYPVDYSLIIAAIEKFKTASAAGTQLARETLIAYADMLRRRHMGNAGLEKIAETLWKKHAEALTYLMENRPDADGGLAQLLIEKSPDLAAAATIATAGRLTLVPDESNKRWIRFRVAEWSSIPGLASSSWTASQHIILIQIEVDPTFVKLFVTLGPGPEAVRNQMFAALEDLMRRKSAKSVSGWKTISSKFVLTRDNMLRADGPEALLDDIKKALEDWMQNEVTAVNMRLQKLVAQPHP